MDISESQMPRCKHVPRRYVDSQSSGDHQDVNFFSKLLNNEVLDLIVGCIDHFNQPGYKSYHSFETYFKKACKQDDLAADLDICDFKK